MASEKELDKALEAGFRDSHDFSTWFLGKTKFADTGARYFWSRSDHPWSKFTWTYLDAETGTEKSEPIESETDVLVVFETPDSRRFALHIENKLASGRFTKFQPELYPERATRWLNDPKYQNYSDFQTVLVAPEAFYQRWEADSRKFDCFLSHEEIASHLPIFAVNED